MDIIKLCLISLGSVLLCLFLKETKPEYVYFITLAVGIIIFSMAVGKIKLLFDIFYEIKQFVPFDELCFPVMIKMLGITYIGHFSAGICKDAGLGTTGSQIELFSRLSVMVLSMPILLALLKTIQEIMI